MGTRQEEHSNRQNGKQDKKQRHQDLIRLSIWFAAPVIRMITVIAMTRICQGRFFILAVTCPKNSAESSVSTVFVTEPARKRSTQPIMIEYPMAIPRDPRRGIQPEPCRQFLSFWIPSSIHKNQCSCSRPSSNGKFSRQAYKAEQADKKEIGDQKSRTPVFSQSVWEHPYVPKPYRRAHTGQNKAK